jgi:hypothetical protein
MHTEFNTDFNEAIVLVFDKSCFCVNTENAAFQMFNEGVCEKKPKVGEWVKLSKSYSQWVLENLFNCVKGGEYIRVLFLTDITELPVSDQQQINELLGKTDQLKPCAAFNSHILNQRTFLMPS